MRVLKLRGSAIRARAYCQLASSVQSVVWLYNTSNVSLQGVTFAFQSRKTVLKMTSAPVWVWLLICSALWSDCKREKSVLEEEALY